MKMKQKMKRLLACTLAFAMLMTLSVVTEAQADEKETYPKTFRLNTSDDIWNLPAVTFTFDEYDMDIANIKTSSPNLIAKRYYHYARSYEGGTPMNIIMMGFAAKKDGTYTVTYDIVKDKKVVSSEKMTVYAYPTPIKSMLLDGSSNLTYKYKKQAKVKVELKAGNKIKKLEVGSYKETKPVPDMVRTELTYKTFKNGDTVKLSSVAMWESEENGDRKSDDYCGYLVSSLYSQTPIKITYVDKYTKQEEELIVNLCGWSK